jgi:hypothetical protein
MAKIRKPIKPKQGKKHEKPLNLSGVKFEDAIKRMLQTAPIHAKKTA